MTEAQKALRDRFEVATALEFGLTYHHVNGFQYTPLRTEDGRLVCRLHNPAENKTWEGSWAEETIKYQLEKGMFKVEKTALKKRAELAKKQQKWAELVTLLDDLGYTPELIAGVISNFANRVAHGDSCQPEQHRAMAELLSNFEYRHKGDLDLIGYYHTEQAIQEDTKFGGTSRFSKYLPVPQPGVEGQQ
jgi:hypothetical protein